MRSLALTAAVLGTIAAAQATGIVGLHCSVLSADPIEREFTCVGQRRPILTTFSTTYRMKNRIVTIGEFWRNLSPGDAADVKVNRYELFSVAVASSISINK